MADFTKSKDQLEREYYDAAFAGTLPGGGGGSSTDVTPLAKEVTLGLRNSGGKLAYVGVVTALGDTTVITPAAGKSIQIFWVYTLTNPDSPTTRITISLAAVPIYTSFGIAHWEPFTGAVNAAVIINLTVASSVAVTIHYKEI